MSQDVSFCALFLALVGRTAAMPKMASTHDLIDLFDMHLLCVNLPPNDT